jgi:hypothetical protein
MGNRVSENIPNAATVAVKRNTISLFRTLNRTMASIIGSEIDWLLVN